MAHVWIKCITIVHAADTHGVLKTYHPNDWCQVGMHQARQLVAQGSAEIQNPATRLRTMELVGCGIVAYGNNPALAVQHLRTTFPEVPVHTDGPPRLAFTRTLILDPSANLKLALLPIGFHRLTTGWWMAAPILPGRGSEYLLAESIGTEADRAATKAIVRDLRCPVYDPRILFASRRPECEAVVAQWLEERMRPGVDDRLAFLRAFYTVKPLMLALPSTWYGR